MKPETRQTFLEWYEIHKTDHFIFDDELIRYCRSDVNILLRSMIKFREIFMDITSDMSEIEREESRVRGDPVSYGLDPFKNCFTIASACNLVFRTKFLQKNTLALIPQHGYNPTGNQSLKALQWLEYLIHRDGTHIQHNRNGGEVYLESKYRVDGYSEKSDGTKVVFQYDGCFYHGCAKCYKPDTRNTLTDDLMSELYLKTIEKKNFSNPGAIHIYRYGSVSLMQKLKGIVKSEHLSRVWNTRHHWFQEMLYLGAESML